MVRGIILALSLILAWSGAAPASDVEKQQEPDAVVEKLHSTLLTVMRRGDTHDFEARFRTLAPVVDATFDLAAVAKFAVGEYWDEFDEAQRDAYLAAFRRFTVGTYADRFDAYDGERFECPETRAAGQGRRLVRCKLIRKGKSPVSLDYMLQKDESGWRIVNVYADGVSDLAVKRQQYRHVIKTEGIDALIQGLRERADRLEEADDESD